MLPEDKPTTSANEFVPGEPGVLTVQHSIDGTIGLQGDSQ